MDKQKLEEEKMKLVGQLNAVMEQIDEYGLEAIAGDGGFFKGLCQKKQGIEDRIKFINKQLAEC